MKTLLLLVIPSSILILLAGCIDDPVQNNIINISGIVVDRTGFPVSRLGVNASSILWAVTNRNGEFSINDVNPPYTIMLLGEHIHNNVFLGVKNQTNVYTLPLEYMVSHDNAYVVVHFPKIGHGHYAFVLFAGNNIYRSYSNYTSHQNDTLVSFNLAAPANVFTIPGKIIFLEFTYDGNNITSYHKFGYKDVVLNCINYSHNEFTFTYEETGNDPEETEVTAVIQNPPGYGNSVPEFYLNFGSSKNNEVNIGRGNSAIVPVLPLTNYKIRVYDFCYKTDESSIESWKYISPGEQFVMINNAPPELIYPVNNAVNISDTSSFIIRDDEKPGVYEFSFSRGSIYNYSYSIYTTKRLFNLNELIFRDDTLASNTRYAWQVRKFTGFQSIDEYLSVPLVNDKICTSIETSGVRYFTTAPRK